MCVYFNIIAMEVEYILLLKYSPELNPIELAFSFLKRKLNEKNVTENVLLAIVECMRLITPQHVITCYYKRRYL